MDMTSLFFTHIQPQLDEQIANELVGYSPAELNDTLQYGDWWNHTPFKRMKFKIEHNDNTFIQWISACDSLMDEQTGNLFEELMKERIRSTIDTQYEIRMKDLADDYREEMKEIKGAA